MIKLIFKNEKNKKDSKQMLTGIKSEEDDSKEIKFSNYDNKK